MIHFQHRDSEMSMVLNDFHNVEELRKKQNISPGSGWWAVPPPNCFVGWRKDADGQAFIEIWPETGGYIECNITHCAVDAAPFAG